MGLLTLVEDRPTPAAVYNWRVYFCAAVASFASCLIGYDSSFIGTSLALPSFRREFGFDDMSKSHVNLISANIVSCYQAGAFFGAFFAYPAGHFLGRRRGLWIFAILFIIGAGIMLGADSSTGLGILYGGRVLAGIGVGGSSNLVPIYISEISPPAVRGRLVGIYELGWQSGGLVGFWINYGVSETLPSNHKQWLIPFAVQLIPAGLLLAGLFAIKESPRWLFTKGRRDEALRNLCWIRQLEPTDIYMIEEVAAIETAVESQRASVGLGFWQPFKAVFSNKKVAYRLFLGSSLFFWQNGSGINAINYYSPTVFKSIGITGTNTSLFTSGLFGVVKTVCTIVWLLFLIDKLGRRKLLMWGAIGGSVCLWIVGGYIAAADPVDHPTKNGKLGSGGVAAVFFFYLWTAFYSPSWNGTPWVINSEMFDQNTRNLAQAFAAASNWLWNFLISRFTPQMFEAMDYGVYFFFASLMILSVFWVFFLIPETKSVPLESMDRLFDRQLPARRANEVVMAEIQENEEQFRQDIQRSGININKEQVEHLENVERIDNVRDLKSDHLV